MRPNSAGILKDLAPTGRLRVAIDLGNPVLAQSGEDGAPKGLSVDFARELVRRTGLPFEFVLYDAAGKVVEALKSNAWDVAFMAIEPERATELEFTEPYVIVDGTYMVTLGSPLKAIADFEKPGIRIALARGSVCHLYLRRTTKHANLLLARTGGDAIAMFIVDNLDAVANLRQPLVRYVAENPGYRVVDGCFMDIRLAVAVPKGRVQAIYYLDTLIEELKASGFVADALEASGQQADVAPL